MPIYEAGTWPNGSAFYTMRLVSGGTLAEAIERAKTTIEGRLALLPHVVAVTDALAYAHDNRIIHRDLKPQNVLVGEFGETVVIDWGLAKELGDDHDDVPARTAAGTDVTMAGSVIGTLCFMPPEQARGEELDERADVFSLGAILYNVLAGEPPYWNQPRETPQQLLEAVLRRSPTPIAELAPQAPADLHAIVERAMAREPAHRYASAKEMAEELRRFQTGKLVAAREYRISDLLARWIRRHRGAVTVGSVAALVLAAVGVIAVVNVTRSRDAERTARVAADTARGAADTSVAALLEEQGRSELVDGHRDRALAYLAEAYRRGRDSVALRHMLAVATRDLDLLEHTLETKGGTFVAAAFLADGRIATIDTKDHARIELWEGDRMVDVIGTGIDARDAAFTHDRTRVVIFGGNELATWDVTTHKQLWQIAGKELVDTHVVIDPTDKRVAILTDLGVQVRELATGAMIGQLASDKQTTGVAFAGDGSTVATCGSEGTIATWTLAPFKPMARFRIPRGLTDVVFAGDQVVVTTKEREAYLWKPGKTTVDVLGGHRGDLTTLAASPLGTMLATGDRTGGVRLWTSTGEALGDTSEPRGEIDTLQFSPDHTLVLGAGQDPRTFVWNTSLGVRGLAQAPDDLYQGSRALAWAPQSDAFATIDQAGERVHIWRRPKGSVIAHVESIASAIAGRVLVIAHGHELAVQDLATGKTRITIELDDHLVPKAWYVHDSDREHLQLSRDGSRALIWGEGFATVYDLVHGATVRALSLSEGLAGGWILSADGMRAVELGDRHVRVIDVDSGKVILEHDEDTGPGGDLTRDGDRLAIAGDLLQIWRISSGEALKLQPLELESQTHSSEGRVVTTTMVTTDVRFDPTGRRVIAFGIETPVIANADTGATVARLHELRDSVDSAAFDGGGRRVVTQGIDDTAIVWDVETGRLLFSVPATAPRAFALSSDGERLATGHPDGTIRIWDVTGRLLETMHEHRRAIERLTFSDDDTRLLSQSADGWATELDVHLETRTPAEISAIAERATTWQVTGGHLVRRTSP